jgi:hypothetical protein
VTKRSSIAAVLSTLVGLALFAAVSLAGVPRSALHNFNCHTAMNPAERSVSIVATMRPVAHTRQMQMRVWLLDKRGGGSAHALHGGDLGTWISPANSTLGQRPGDIWNLDKSVVNLSAPGVYRFRVQFRWLGWHHQVLETVQRISRQCRQRELRPDLLVRSITVSSSSSHAGEAVYRAVIFNAGNSGAGPFQVMFATADGSTTITHTIDRLPAHHTALQKFLGPVCTASSDPTITVDSADQVDDRNRANNSMTARCPSDQKG